MRVTLGNVMKRIYFMGLFPFGEIRVQKIEFLVVPIIVFRNKVPEQCIHIFSLHITRVTKYLFEQVFPVHFDQTLRSM